MIWLRLIVAVLLLGAFAVAVVPLLVLLDLASGDSGYGLCPAGVGACDFGYLRPMEITAYLALALFVFVGAIRLAVKVYSRVERFMGRS
jgi:hypothetical protein